MKYLFNMYKMDYYYVVSNSFSVKTMENINGKSSSTLKFTSENFHDTCRRPTTTDFTVDLSDGTQIVFAPKVQN